MDDEDQKPANISSYLNYDWVPNYSYLDKNDQPTVPTVKLETDIGRQQFPHRVDGNRTEIGIECKQEEDLTSHLDFSWLENRRHEATLSSETIATSELDKQKNDIPQKKDVIILSVYKEESLENHLDFDWLPPKRDATLAQSKPAVIDVIDLASSEFTCLGNVTKLESPELAVINTFSEIASSKISAGTAFVDNVNVVSSDEVDGFSVSNLSISKSAMMNNFAPLQPAVTDSVSNLESLLSLNTDSGSNLASLRPAAIDSDSLETTLKSKSSDCFTNLSSSESLLTEKDTSFKEGTFMIKDDISRLSSSESTVLNNVATVLSSESTLIENTTTLQSMKSVLTNDVTNLNPSERFKSDIIEDIVDFVSRESLIMGSATTLLPFRSVVFEDVSALPSVESVNMDNAANVLSSGIEIVPDVDTLTAVNSELCLESSEITTMADVETLCKKESSSLSDSNGEPESSSVIVLNQELCSLSVPKQTSKSSYVTVCKQEPHPFTVEKQEPCSSPLYSQTSNFTAAACKDSDLYKNKCLEHNKKDFKENKTLQLESNRNKSSRSDNIFDIMGKISNVSDETCRRHLHKNTTNVNNSNIDRHEKHPFNKKAKLSIPLNNNDENDTQVENKEQQLQFNGGKNLDYRARSGDIKPTDSDDNNVFDNRMTALTNKESDSTVNISNDETELNTPISDMFPSPVRYATQSSSHNNDVKPDIVTERHNDTPFGLRNEYSKGVKSDFSSSLMEQKGRWHVAIERLNAKYLVNGNRVKLSTKDKSLVDPGNSQETEENDVIECVDSKKEMYNSSVSNCGLRIRIKKSNLDTPGDHANYGSNLEKGEKEVSFDPKITNVMHDDNSIKSNYHVNKDNEGVVNENNCIMEKDDACMNNETSCVTDITDKEDEDMKNETSCMDKEVEDVNNETNCVMGIIDKEDEGMHNETNCVMDKEDEDTNNETNSVMDITDKDDEDINKKTNCVMNIMDREDNDINDETYCVAGIVRRSSRQIAMNCEGFYTQGSSNEYSCEDESSHGSHCSQSNSSDDSCNNNTKKKHIGIDKKRRRKKKLGRPWRLKGNIGIFCQFCPKYVAKNKTEMLRHEITTSHLMQRFGKKSFVTKKYECNVCSTRFCHKKSVFRHYRKYHGKFAAEGDTEECTWCIHYRDLDVNDKTDPLLSKQHQVLKDHYSSHIARSRTTITREDNCCDICNKTFTSKQTLEEHIPTHFENYNNICLLCNENCHDRNKLIRHILTHFETNINRDTIPYGYDTCTENESNHNESEIDKKPFSEIWKVLSWKKDKLNKKNPAKVGCKTCPNFTTNSFTLMLLHERMTFHVRTKFSESELAYLKYECPVCSARYKRSDNLKGHFKSKHMPKSARADGKSPENEDDTHPSKGHTIAMSETQNYDTDSIEERKKSTLVCASGKKENISRSESQIMKCDMCFDILSSKQSFNDHIRAHFQMTSFKCELCKQEFPNREDLIKHLSNHDTVEQKCDLCEQRFPMSDDLRIHRNCCHRIQGNECPSYDLDSGSPRQNDINCEDLDIQRFGNDNSCEERSNHDNDCSQGNISDESCKTNPNKKHIRISTKRKRKRTQKDNIDIVCEFCPEYMAKSNAEMIRHEKTTSHLMQRFGKKSFKTKKYECNVCSTRFNYKKSVNRHYRKYHGKFASEGDTEECTWCIHYRDLDINDRTDPILSKQHQVLKHHYFSHIARSRTTITREDNCCDICNKTFTSKQTLDKHIPTHFENYNNICMLCNEDCQDRNKLIRHILTHFEANIDRDAIPYGYDTCTENESNHNESDIDKKPFSEIWKVLSWKKDKSNKKNPAKVECKTCPNFTTESFTLMLLHERMTFHVRTKFDASGLEYLKYECPVCSARYKRFACLKGHLKSKHMPKTARADSKDLENEDYTNPIKRQKIIVSETQNYDTDSSEEKRKSTLVCASGEKEDTSRSESQILKCDMCFEILSSKQSFNDHIRTHFQMTSFKCELCRQVFPNREDLIKHLSNHDTIEQNCDLCKQHFSTLDDLRIHRISCHRIQDNERPSYDLVTGSTRQNDINCEDLGTPECGSEDSEDSSYQENNCSQGNISDESCNTNDNKAHIQITKKRRRKRTQKKNIDIFCECCPEYMAKNKKEMRRHESTTSHLIRRFGKTSLETRPYECNVCSARFSGKQSLIVDHYENYHGKYVVEGDTMECTWCNYYRDLHVDVKESQKCRVLKKHVCSHIARSRAMITLEDNCCEICKKHFTSKQTLGEHIPTHFENYNNICMLCNQDCQNRTDLVHHIPTHFEAHLNKDNIPFEYDTCSENDSNDKVRIDKIPFTESWNVLTWKRNKSFKKCPNKVKCKTCPNFTTTSFNLMKLHERMTFHIRTKFGESGLKSFKYECPLCSVRYRRANSFREHFKSKHVPRVAADDRKSPEKASEILKCDMCFEVLSSKQSFNDHIQTHFQMKSFKCELCKHEFPNRDELAKHMFNHHTGGEQCDLCERRFYTIDELQQHRSCYHRIPGEKRFPCELCPEVFKTEKGFNFHIKRVHIDKAYACEHCGKFFRHKDRLAVHTIGVHTKQFQFRCHICGKGLFFQAALDDHLKQHEGIERFECKICGEKFSARWKKCKHMRDHKLEERKNKPELMLVCDICGKKFVQKISLKQHLYVHAGKKTFKCEICGRFFARSDNLVTHKRTHTGHKPYSCDTCGKEFARVDNLKTHIRKMHF